VKKKEEIKNKSHMLHCGWTISCGIFVTMSHKCDHTLERFARWICFYKKGFANECPNDIFKDSKLRNYSLKKLNASISDAMNAQVCIKTYYLKSLKNVLRVLVSISLIKR